MLVQIEIPNEIIPLLKTRYKLTFLQKKSHVCNICWQGFDTEYEIHLHVYRYHTVLGTCPICKKERELEKHHYSYSEYHKNKLKNTIYLCDGCHGMQQCQLANTTMQKLIRKGIEIVYIGHMLGLISKEQVFPTINE